MDNLQHHAQFQRLISKENVRESLANISNFADSTNMGGNVFASHAGNMSYPPIDSSKETWIIDTGTSNHMISDKNMLTNEVKMHVSDSNRQVHLPNGGSVVVSNIGTCEVIDGQTVSNVLHIQDFRFNLMSVSSLSKE